MTTTDLTPEEIHQIGLKQVAETEAEMLALAHKLGFKDLASLNEHIKDDRRFYATSGEQVLDLYTKYTRQMEKELPQLFGRLPQNKLEVIPMDPFRAKNAVPADYMPGAQDGSRPGHINVNEWDPEHRLTLNIEAIAYHEGVPGHHLQISIGQELKDLPAFRKNGDYTAFIEGWALYSERLGKEIGFYQDPYSDYGQAGERNVAGHPAGHRYRSAREALVAGPDGGLFPSLHRDGRAQCANRSGPLHCLAGAGAGIQTGTAGNFEIT